MNKSRSLQLIFTLLFTLLKATYDAGTLPVKITPPVLTSSADTFVIVLEDILTSTVLLVGI